MAHFTVRSGVRCQVKKVGEEDWREHRTTKVLEFDRGELVDNGGRFLFVDKGWKLRVARCFVTAKGWTKPTDATSGSPGVGTFNKSILGKNGRGSSRRRRRR